MCFDHDSRPPIAPILGGALESRETTLEATDGNRLTAFEASAADPAGAAILILPDVRGLHPYYVELALRFAEHGMDAVAIDWFGRTAGLGIRQEGFEYMPHVDATTWRGLQADIRAGAEHARALRNAAPLFTVGFCFGGRLSFLSATLGLDLAGAVGFYGNPVGPGRGGSPPPVELAGDIGSPILGLFGGADRGIPPQAVATFEDALAAAGVDHRLVTYPDAPHSFFDRKADQYSAESAAAWDEIRAFLAAHGAG
jgi:carboxymethylenebutenolidase